MNKRRELLIAASAGIFAAPLACFGQQAAKIRSIGYLTATSAKINQGFETFRQALRELGHVEGKTIQIEYRSVKGKYEELPTLAAELVRRNVDVLVVNSTPAAIAAKNATRTIPIVFTGVSDPVGQGVVASLARPGGNVTGMSLQHPETAVKTLELLKEIVPGATRIAVLSNPANPSMAPVVQEIQLAARKLRLETNILFARTLDEVESAAAELAQYRPNGWVIPTESLFVPLYSRLAAIAVAQRIAAIGGTPAFSENGGLISYGANRAEHHRRAAVLVDRVLKGAKPADLPVEQPTKFDLVVNLKAAKAIGITLPPTIMVRAERVIE